MTKAKHVKNLKQNSWMLFWMWVKQSLYVVSLQELLRGQERCG